MNSTWFDSETCTDYSCVYDSEANDISIVEKTGFLNFLFLFHLTNGLQMTFQSLERILILLNTIVSLIGIQSQHFKITC